MSDTFEINGVKYSKKQNEEKKPMPSGAMKIAMIGMMLGGMDALGSTYQKERPNVNIIQEYAKIQRKESNLSRNDRDWVVRVFERNYEKIE